MKIGILSDSHDNMPAITSAVGMFNDAEVDLVIHGGDLISPFVSKPLKHLKAPFVAVFGNNDGERLGLSNIFHNQIFRAPHSITFAEKKICILHEPDNLKPLVNSGDFNAIIYGHTHEIDIQKGRTLLINPGESCGWLSGNRTAVIWDIAKGRVDVIHI